MAAQFTAPCTDCDGTGRATAYCASRFRDKAWGQAMGFITSINQLEAVYGHPTAPSTVKEIDHIAPCYRAFIEASPFVALATAGPEGLDVVADGNRIVGIELEPLSLPNRLNPDLGPPARRRGCHGNIANARAGNPRPSFTFGHPGKRSGQEGC